MNKEDNKQRLQIERFWCANSKKATIEEMFLDRGASLLSSEEQPEILSFLPSIKSKNVLELGAGIGRFTGIFAESAKHVTAVDFMENFVDKNRENNGHMDNIDFIHADVTQLELPANSFDLVFSNWLLMYLREDEVRDLTAKILTWLTPDGYAFYRESCCRPAGGVENSSIKPDGYNPTFYRHPSVYEAIFQEATEGNKNKVGDAQDGNTGSCSRFKPVNYTHVTSYAKLRNNPNQLCWLLQKAACNEEKKNMGDI